MDDSSNNTFTDNTLSNNSRHGINLEFSSNYNFIEKNSIVRNTTNNESWSMFVDSDAKNNTFEENTVGSKYPTKISVYDYHEGFNIRGVEDPPESPTTGQNISKYVEMQNLSANTTLFIDFHYEDKAVVNVNESKLEVWRYKDTAWDLVPPPNGVNTVENYVYANITKFSVFAPLTNEGGGGGDGDGDTTRGCFHPYALA